jgi:hypothetical protein
LCCSSSSPLASAHKASDSYLILEVNGSEVSGQWDIALRDIDFALGLDVDGNGEITWGELRARHADIDAWALGRLGLQRGGACRIRGRRPSGRHAHRRRLRGAATDRRVPARRR